jgi:hypothetical protein
VNFLNTTTFKNKRRTGPKTKITYTKMPIGKCS